VATGATVLFPSSKLAGLVAAFTGGKGVKAEKVSEAEKVGGKGAEKVSGTFFTIGIEKGS
jgi:hypothetical protein